MAPTHHHNDHHHNDRHHDHAHHGGPGRGHRHGGRSEDPGRGRGRGGRRFRDGVSPGDESGLRPAVAGLLGAAHLLRFADEATRRQAVELLDEATRLLRTVLAEGPAAPPAPEASVPTA